MCHTIVTYTVKPGRAEENAALVRAAFKELANIRPGGFRYAVFQALDSGEFVHLYTDEGATRGTLQQLPAFQAFVAEAADRHEQPATFTEFELIGDYRTFDGPDHLSAADRPDTEAAHAAEIPNAHTSAGVEP
jgi:quinol monooxygenase YgiN